MPSAGFAYNGLAATAGVRVRRKNGYIEPPIITSGDDLVAVGQFIRPGATSYSAEDVVNCLLDPFLKTADAAG